MHEINSNHPTICLYFVILTRKIIYCHSSESWNP